MFNFSIKDLLSYRRCPPSWAGGGSFSCLSTMLRIFSSNSRSHSFSTFVSLAILKNNYGRLPWCTLRPSAWLYDMVRLCTSHQNHGTNVWNSWGLISYNKLSNVRTGVMESYDSVTTLYVTSWLQVIKKEENKIEKIEDCQMKQNKMHNKPEAKTCQERW